MSTVAAIILAAGRGTRFGAAPKLLALLGDRPLVRHVAETAAAAELAPILVVTGHGGEAVGAALVGLPVTTVTNPAFAEGMSTSLKAGFAALPADAGAALVLLGDMPLVGPDLVATLVSAWEANGRPDAVVPMAAGRRCNPVLLSRRLAPAIARLTGDRGAGPLLRDHPGVLEVAVADQGAALDIDTPAALAQARRVQANTTPSKTAE